MRIDGRLNLVIPVGRNEERPDPTAPGKTETVFVPAMYVHSSPISAEVFEANFMLVSRTFSAIYAQGLGAVAGPRVAAMLLRRVARTTDDDRSADALLAEIRRLSNVLAPTARGYETIPLEEAVQKEILPREDASEVENAVVFFTVCSAMHRRADLRAALEGATSLWGAQTTSSSCTEFLASLPTSTAGETTPPSPTAAAEAGSSVLQ